MRLCVISHSTQIFKEINSQIFGTHFNFALYSKTRIVQNILSLLLATSFFEKIQIHILSRRKRNILLANLARKVMRFLAHPIWWTISNSNFMNTNMKSAVLLTWLKILFHFLFIRTMKVLKSVFRIRCRRRPRFHHFPI